MTKKRPNFREMDKMLEECPTVYLPALIMTIVRVGIEKNVWGRGMANRFVKLAEDRIGKEASSDG